MKWSMRKFVVGVCWLLWGCCVFSQGSPFQIALEPMEIKDMPGLHSFAFGQADGEWLLLGGRVDGLHRRQPFAAFDSAGHNEQLVVVSPRLSKVWTADMRGLSVSIQEQLRATNPQFHQLGKMLYVVGGYGYSPTLGDHTTYEYLTVIDVAAAITAIKAGTDLSPHFQQFQDSRFAVTGGQLAPLYDRLYLVGGHRFSGRYNPMGPDRGPGFVQVYNHWTLPFFVTQETVHFEQGIQDEVYLHRRDFNLVPQILKNGREGLTAFSGVFQYKADVPYLHCVDLEEGTLTHHPDFQQHYQQYHCPKVPLFSKRHDEMHNLFLGGIAEYYDSTGYHVLDCNVPFVKTVARVTRDRNGILREYKLPVEMPDYLGASAEFIPLPGLPQYPNGVLKLDDLPTDKTLIGYIVGGIKSSDDNIFWVNEGEHSTANTQVLQVFLSKSATAPADAENLHSSSPLQLEVLPDPFKAVLSIDFVNPTAGDVSLLFKNAKGKSVLKKTFTGLNAGPQHLDLPCKALKKGGRFFLTLTTAQAALDLKVVVEL
jgi:hypothetical protein